VIIKYINQAKMYLEFGNCLDMTPKNGRFVGISMSVIQSASGALPVIKLGGSLEWMKGTRGILALIYGAGVKK
jgi:hypothetical protein